MISDEDYVATVEQLKLLAGLVLKMPLDGVVERMERAEAVGPIVDPTLYRNAMRGLGDQRKLVEAAREFKRAVQKAIGEAIERDHGRGT